MFYIPPFQVRFRYIQRLSCELLRFKVIFQYAEWIYFRMHGLQQGRGYISLVTVHEAKNNFWFTLREDGWHGEISFYGIGSLLLLLSQFNEGNQEINGYLF